MNRKQLIEKYIEFFKSKNHKEIPNSSLIPENDPTVLFTTAGMHPLVPFLLGQKHLSGKRLVNVQRCIRTGDIEEVGDTTHHTFFEMLGNWSLGDYFKKEAIEFSFEFLTKILKIPVERLAVTVFAGDKDAPKDIGSSKIWESLGIPKQRIAFLPKKDNWWDPAGNTGPCGPDTEMFYWKSTSEKAPEKFNPDDKNWVEIWNDVLMQYNKIPKKQLLKKEEPFQKVSKSGVKEPHIDLYKIDGERKFGETKSYQYQEALQKNIDTGMGVERTIAVLNNLEDNYEAEMWKPIIKEIEKLSKKKYGKNNEDTRAMRIIADHIKASVFIINDGIVPSNTEQGYVLRRLIRRAVRYGKFLGIENFTKKIAEPIFSIYEDYKLNKKKILEELEKEEEKFTQTIEKGLRIYNKGILEQLNEPLKNLSKEINEPLKNLQLLAEQINRPIKQLSKEINEPIEKINKTMKPIHEMMEKIKISCKTAFLLYQSYGFPIEITKDLAKERGIKVDEKGFEKELAKHQTLSRTASAGKFKSGLADNSEATTKLHTAAHLLMQALRAILKNPNIMQKGSNITPERLRMDFNFDRKLTDEEIKQVEDLVNAKIQQKCEVCVEEMTPTEAKKKGAIGVFDDKYNDKVSVYSIADFSKEICAGPHVKNTCELGKFKITKQESSSAGVRRIKGVLE